MHVFDVIQRVTIVCRLYLKQTNYVICSHIEFKDKKQWGEIEILIRRIRWFVKIELFMGQKPDYFGII